MCRIESPKSAYSATVRDISLDLKMIKEMRAVAQYGSFWDVL
jgi:hypothetical protein